MNQVGFKQVNFYGNRISLIKRCDFHVPFFSFSFAKVQFRYLELFDTFCADKI